MSDETLRDIYALIDQQQGRKSIGSIINEVINSQGGAIAFFSVGIAFIAIALIVGFTVCCMRCCCNSCYAKREQDADASKIPLFLLIFVLIASIAFIVTGIIIFNQSSLNLYSSIDESTSWVDTVITELNSSLNNGTTEIQCSVNASVSSSFGNVETQMSAYPANVFSLFFQQSGITALENYDMSILDTEVSTSIALTTIILEDINVALLDFGGTDCGQNLRDMSIQLTGTQTVMTQVNQQLTQTVQPGLNQTLQEANDISNQSEAQMNTTVSSTLTQMQSAQAQITQILTQINSTVNQMMEIVYNVQKGVDNAHDKIESWNAYTPVKNSIRAAMTVPNAIALFFVTFVTIALVVRLVKTNDPRERSGLSNFMGYFSIIGFYIVIFLTLLAMGIASASFVGGWAISGACKPMFEDNTFYVYGLIDDLTFTLSANGQSINVSTKQILSSCYAHKTMFAAINGSALLNAQSINSQIDLGQYQAPIDQVIDNTNFNYNIDPSVTNALETVKTAAAGQASLYSGQQASGFLPNCESNTQKIAKILEGLTNLTTTLNNVSVQINQLVGLVENVTTNAADTAPLKEQMKNYTNGQFQLANTTINNSTNSLVDQLNNVSFPCYPVYTVYSNIGSIICDRFGRPVHGLWAAAGLAALFFIPAAIALLCATRWLFIMKYGKDRFHIGDEYSSRRQKKNKKNKSSYEDESIPEDDIFARPPITAYPDTRQLGQMNQAYLSDDHIQQWATGAVPAANRQPMNNEYEPRPAPRILNRPDEDSVVGTQRSKTRLHRPDAPERWDADSEDGSGSIPKWSSSALRRA